MNNPFTKKDHATLILEESRKQTNLLETILAEILQEKQPVKKDNRKNNKGTIGNKGGRPLITKKERVSKFFDNSFPTLCTKGWLSVVMEARAYNLPDSDLDELRVQKAERLENYHNKLTEKKEIKEKIKELEDNLIKLN